MSSHMSSIFDYILTSILCRCYSYKILVHPILEYANVIRGPYYINDQKLLERVQRRATKLVPLLKKLPYVEHLSHLKLPSLCYRRKQGDMILVYQILNGLLMLIHLFSFVKLFTKPPEVIFSN